MSFPDNCDCVFSVSGVLHTQVTGGVRDPIDFPLCLHGQQILQMGQSGPFQSDSMVVEEASVLD